MLLVCRLPGNWSVILLMLCAPSGTRLKLAFPQLRLSHVRLFPHISWNFTKPSSNIHVTQSNLCLRGFVLSTGDEDSSYKLTCKRVSPSIELSIHLMASQNASVRDPFQRGLGAAIQWYSITLASVAIERQVDLSIENRHNSLTATQYRKPTNEEDRWHWWVSRTFYCNPIVNQFVIHRVPSERFW
jgi:hypothetical protein